jgi:predicted ThiF/HesA family dinucleotide-utilizing enzyme
VCRIGEVLHGCHQISLPRQEVAQTQVGKIGIRVQPQRLGVTAHGPDRIALFFQSEREIEVSFPKPGPELNCFRE